MADVEAFVAQWGLDTNAHMAITVLPEHAQRRVLTDFAPKPGTRDVNRLFHGFLKSVSTGGKGAGRGAPTAAQAFAGGYGGMPIAAQAFAPHPAPVADPFAQVMFGQASAAAVAAQAAPSAVEIQTFLQQWGLDGGAYALLLDQPPEVQARVVTEFAPKPGTRDINKLFHGFVRSLRQTHFPHLQAAAPAALSFAATMPAMGGIMGPPGIPDAGEGAALVQLFAAQWGLDEANQVALLQLDPATQARVIADFAPRQGTKDVNKLFSGFLRTKSMGMEAVTLPQMQAHDLFGGELAAALGSPGLSMVTAEQAHAINAAAQAEIDAAMAQLIAIGTLGQQAAMPGVDVVALQAFIDQWGLDASAQAILVQLDPVHQQKVMTDFAPKPGTRDVNRLFHGFVKSVGVAVTGVGAMMPSAAAVLGPPPQFIGEETGKRPGIAGETATPEELGAFVQGWGLGPDCAVALEAQPLDVQKRVLEQFRPKPGTRDVRSLFYGFIRSVAAGGGGGKRPRFA